MTLKGQRVHRTREGWSSLTSSVLAGLLSELAHTHTKIYPRSHLFPHVWSTAPPSPKRRGGVPSSSSPTASSCLQPNSSPFHWHPLQSTDFQSKAAVFFHKYRDTEIRFTQIRAAKMSLPMFCNLPIIHLPLGQGQSTSPARQNCGSSDTCSHAWHTAGA